MIAVGARCTHVRANESIVVRECCVLCVRGLIMLAFLFSTSHVFALGGNG